MSSLPPPLPAPTFSKLTTSSNLCLWILHQPLDADSQFRTSIHQPMPEPAQEESLAPGKPATCKRKTENWKLTEKGRKALAN